MIQADSLHLSLQENKGNFTESHCKHLEAAFDHKNTQSATSDLAPGMLATVTFRNRKKIQFVIQFHLLMSGKQFAANHFNILKLQ